MSDVARVHLMDKLIDCMLQKHDQNTLEKNSQYDVGFIVVFRGIYTPTSVAGNQEPKPQHLMLIKTTTRSLPNTFDLSIDSAACSCGNMKNPKTRRKCTCNHGWKPYMVIMTPNHQYHKGVLFNEFRKNKWSRKGQTQDSSNSNMFIFDQDKYGKYWMWNRLLKLREQAYNEIKIIMDCLNYDSPDKDEESKQIRKFDNLKKKYTNFNNLEVSMDTQFEFKDKTLNFSTAKTNRSSLFDCILRLEGKVSLDYTEVLKKSIEITSAKSVDDNKPRPGLFKNSEKNIPLEHGKWYRYRHRDNIIKGMYDEVKGLLVNLTFEGKIKPTKTFKDLNAMIRYMHNPTNRNGKTFTCRDVIEILVGKAEGSDDIWMKYGEYLRQKER